MSVLTARRLMRLSASAKLAARAYQVPLPLLKSMVWVRSRGSMQSGVVGPAGAVGIMQLTDAQQAQGAALTGVAVGRLKVDRQANLNAGAALLRAGFDASARENHALNQADAADWYFAVSMFDGAETVEVAAPVAQEVYAAMERGFSVERAEGRFQQLPQTCEWRRHAPAFSSRADALADYPGQFAYVQSPNKSTGHGSYDFVLIHTMQGSYAGCRSWFQSTQSGVSAHYIVRSSDGQITQMVSESDTAWHAQCYNGRSIGIEHEGFIADPGTWYTDAMYTESAKLTAWTATRHGIPKDRSHIIGHGEVSPNCNTNGHTDPGSGWNWTKYMDLVTNGGTSVTTGTLLGAIYQNGDTSNRVQGAVVTVNGMSVTTGADGMYQFQVAPGSVTATVSKSGYTSNSVTRTVTANAQTWGSMEINPSGAVGTLSGKVYAFNAGTPSDMSQVLSGATVSVNGQMVTTAGDGLFSFTLAPGTYSLQVAKSGYETNASTRTVMVGQTTDAPIGLSLTSSQDQQPPTVLISFPLNTVHLDIANVQVTGTASDDRGAISNVTLVLNGAAGVQVPVTSGQFSYGVKLRPGANTIVVSATDGAGNPGSAMVTAFFSAGVQGEVFLQGDESMKIAGARVELRAVGAATPLDTVTTGADGKFGIDVVTPGDYLLTVKANGYLSSAQTVTASDSQRAVVSVGLVPGEDMASGPTVTIVDPMDGATVTSDTVTIYGSVSGFDASEVTVNGATAELLAAGGFLATVPLPVVGANAIIAEAHGTASQSARAQIVLKRVVPNEGVVGYVGCSIGSGGVSALVALTALRRRRRTQASINR